MVYTSEIAHNGCTRYIKVAADLLGRYNLFKGANDLSHQSAGDTVIAGQKCVVLKETLTAVTAVAALAEVKEGVSCQRDILYGLHPIVVYTVSGSSTDRVRMLFTGEFEIDMEFLRNVFHVCDNYIFQIEKFCCLILIEHRDSPLL